MILQAPAIEAVAPNAHVHIRGSRCASQAGRVWLWLLLGFALIAGGAAWWRGRVTEAVGPGAAASAPGGPASGAGAGRRFGGANRVQPVSVMPVRRQDVRVSISAVGAISASTTTTVRAQVSGVLQSLNFKEGEPVKAGQLLAQIDPRALQAALAQAEGTLARDKAQLENARLDLARYRDLLAKDALPRQQLETQQALVRQLEGTIKAEQAAVDNAQLQLSYTRVTAPISGRAGLKQADVGNIVQQGDAGGIVTITQTRPIALLFSVPAVHVPLVAARLHAKEPLPVEAWDRHGTRRLAVGRLATLDNAIDPATDTIKLKALFANDDDALYPNQAVSVRLQLDTQSDVLAVPQAAVLRGAQGFYVYVVNADSSVSVRPVKPGAVDGDWTAVEGALDVGERVVIDGVDRLREGARVEVIASDPRQRAGASAPAGGGRRGPRGGAASGASGAGRGFGESPGAPRAQGPRQAASAPPAAEQGGEERPRWLDRLPPDVAEKVMKMSPEERREWIQKRREERAKSGN